MITSDLHMHTLYSHARDSVAGMFTRAREKNLSIIGFTEHSPRPVGYDYPNEYRDKLSAGFPNYVKEVQALQDEDNPRVLLAMEMDWIGAEKDFVLKAIRSWPFDYLIGSVHFIGRWGFDASAKDWENISKRDREKYYREYFLAINDMAQSGLFQIAAHLDLIKIFSIDTFHDWLCKPEATELIKNALCSIRDAGMALEISSAGLRKPCAEIYPGPQIMSLAAELNVQISFASDAHAANQIAFAFDKLADYAASFGYRHSLIFCRGEKFESPFL